MSRDDMIDVLTQVETAAQKAAACIRGEDHEAAFKLMDSILNTSTWNVRDQLVRMREPTCSHEKEWMSIDEGSVTKKCQNCWRTRKVKLAE